jgi:hypothetical protein
MCDGGCHLLIIAIAVVALVYMGFIGVAVIMLFLTYLCECLCNCIELSRDSFFQESASVSVNVVKQITKPMRNNTIVPSDIVMVRNPDGKLQLGIISMV